ncbi:MAG TPA: aminoacyl-tRNA hydrolase [Parvularculaceae bacterium]|nr:aminoacyl-tRNA hydrolase [Parvularculaceae bacterium]HNS86612.1 aminoacyl-tRNA hydrolase [Parvularculaceae bacterium]
MLLLVGLGNPGEKYKNHRHNVGFMAVDAIADAHRFGAARSKFQGELREGEIDGGKAIALKPQTYMNESGRAVGAAMRFFKLSPADVIVFHDELDLAAGKIKVKCGGGNAGHNGLRSIDEHIGNDFRRVRIGIGHPGDKARVTGHVLGDFAKADCDWLNPLLAAIAKESKFLAEGDARFATAVAQALTPPKPPKEKREAPANNAPASAHDASEAKPANAMTETLQKLFGKKDGNK